MIILTIRTDKPEAEIGLYDDGKRLTYATWQANRQLAETIHRKIEAMLESKKKVWSDIDGIVCYQGPGSFTGLRIGLTVGNALSYSLEIPIVATQKDDWIQAGIDRLVRGENDELVLPHYGSPPHITQQKK